MVQEEALYFGRMVLLIVATAAAAVAVRRYSGSTSRAETRGRPEEAAAPGGMLATGPSRGGAGAAEGGESR